MTKSFTINTPEYQEAQEKFYEANIIGMIVWFACGNDKICGSSYNAFGISMDVITVLNSGRKYDI